MLYGLVFNFQAGLIEEMMDDTFESLEDDDLEEEADQEVEKILWEVTSGKMNTVTYAAENFRWTEISPSPATFTYYYYTQFAE